MQIDRLVLACTTNPSSRHRNQHAPRTWFHASRRAARCGPWPAASRGVRRPGRRMAAAAAPISALPPTACPAGRRRGYRARAGPSAPGDAKHMGGRGSGSGTADPIPWPTHTQRATVHPETAQHTRARKRTLVGATVSRRRNCTRLEATLSAASTAAAAVHGSGGTTRVAPPDSCTTLWQAMRDGDGSAPQLATGGGGFSNTCAASAACSRAAAASPSPCGAALLLLLLLPDACPWLRCQWLWYLSSHRSQGSVLSASLTHASQQGRNRAAEEATLLCRPHNANPAPAPSLCTHQPHASAHSPCTPRAAAPPRA